MRDREPLGAALGGGVAGLLGGFGIYFGIPDSYGFEQGNPWIVPAAVWHGAVLALGICRGLRSFPKSPRRGRGIATFLGRMVLRGTVAGALAGMPAYLIIRAEFVPAELVAAPYWILWGLSFGGAVALGLALAHLPELLRPGRGSNLLTLLLCGLGAGLGEVRYWQSMLGLMYWTTALCQGYAFGVCFFLGTRMFRGPAGGEKESVAPTSRPSTSAPRSRGSSR